MLAISHSMIKLVRTLFTSALILLPILASAGCYQRTTAATYDYDQSEVKKIREQLGAITADQEFTNEEEEEDE